MSAARLKRRVMAWERYHQRTGSQPTSGHAQFGRFGTYHRGHIMAIAALMGHGRRAPHGLRRVFLLHGGA